MAIAGVSPEWRLVKASIFWVFEFCDSDCGVGFPCTDGEVYSKTDRAWVGA